MYKDTIIQKYLDLIKSERKEIRGFYNGLVAKITRSMLPAIMITIVSVETESISNVEDEHRIGLSLTYIADIRKDFNATPFIVAGLNKVTEVLVGREDDYKLQEKSILNILRKNINLDVNNKLRTDVGSFSVVTPDEVAAGRLPGFWSAEGTIRFIAHFSQLR